MTFKALKDLSLAASSRLAELLQLSQDGTSGTIGLLSLSGLEFVLTWLGLMRTGCTVFLLA